MERHSIAAGLALLVALPTAAIAQSGTSRHCKETEKFLLVEGTYDGSFTFEVTAEGGEQLANQKWKMTLGVQTTLVVDSPYSIEKIKGPVRYSFAGAGNPGDFMVAGLDFTGEGDLKLSRNYNRPGPRDLFPPTFGAEAEIKTSGGAFAAALVEGGMGGASQAVDPEKTKETLALDFEAETVSCDEISGKVEAKQVEQTKTVLAGKGFKVSGESKIPFKLTTGRDLSKKVEELKKELEKTAPQGIVRRREDEGARLGAILDKIKQGPKGEIPCLAPIWFEHVRRRLESWVREDAKKLEKYNGDVPGLNGLLRESISTDKQLVLVGLDTCAEGAHERLWEAMQGASARMLDRMAARWAPPADLIAVYGEVTVLGTVSPALDQKTQEAIRGQARQQLDGYARRFRQLRKDAAAAKGDRCSPAILEAFRAALWWEKQLVLMAGESPWDMVGEATTLACGASR